MTIKSNGRQRDPKYVFSSIFLFLLGLLCLFLTFRGGFRFKYLLITVIVFFFAIRMFANANES